MNTRALLLVMTVVLLLPLPAHASFMPAHLIDGFANIISWIVLIVLPIGFIALFGICVQNGVILITKFKSNIVELKHHETWTFPDAIKDGITVSAKGDRTIQSAAAVTCVKFLLTIRG